ncbi:hypothetical protein MYCO108962_26260 [Mycobacterium colombiense]
MTNTCWWRWCTISRATACPSPRWYRIWGWRMPAGVRVMPRVGRRWRCSMPITRCGSVGSSVMWPMPTARSRRSWPTGSRSWPGFPSAWRCPPIGPTHRSPITAALTWPWSGRPNCSSRSPRWPASTTPPASWSSRPPWRCCSPSSAPATTSRSDSRSPDGVTPRWMSWWAFSSTPWCCGSIWSAIPPWPSCWPRCVSAAWPPTSTKTCPSRYWSSGSTRPGPSIITRWSR